MLRFGQLEAIGKHAAT